MVELLDKTVKDLLLMVKETGAGSMQVVLRHADDSVLALVVVAVGEDAQLIQAAVDACEEASNADSV